MKTAELLKIAARGLRKKKINPTNFIMLHKRFIISELVRTKKQSLIFIMCVILSIITLVALDGFSESVNRSIIRDAKVQHGGDIIIRSNFPFSKKLAERILSLEKSRQVRTAKTYRFHSVVRTQNSETSLLADIKVVDNAYPLYGNVMLASGRDFGTVLKKGKVVVEKGVLDRLGMNIGDRLYIGKALLLIEDVVNIEPDRPVSFLTFGPRIFVSVSDMDGLGLVTKGSRVKYNCFVKTGKEKLTGLLTTELKALAIEGQERVEAARNMKSRVKRFLDNLIFFLSMIGIFTLLLAGIGIWSSLTAWLKEREETIAIIKTLGGSSRFIISHYLVIAFMLGLVGIIMGIPTGFILQQFLPGLFKGLLPDNIEMIIPTGAALKGLMIGGIVVGLFTFIPLDGLKDIRPVAIFKKESWGTKRGPAFYVIGIIIFFFFSGLVLWEIEEMKIGAFFTIGIIILIVITALLTRFVLGLLKRLSVKSLVVRQAQKGLFRPKNSTGPIIITLTASLAFILSIFLVEQNLDAAFVQSYPEDSPNVFIMDIQPSQKGEVSKHLGGDTVFYPVIRGRVLSINKKTVNVEAERKKKSDNLARVFNLTYRDHLLEDEVIIKGRRMFRDDFDSLQVSVLDHVQEFTDIDIGDIIMFNIQGVKLKATVTSIRSRTRETIKPFFYFVFPEETLNEAPQIIFSALSMPKADVPHFRSRIAGLFPNISIVDITETISRFSTIMHRLSLIVRFFTLFSIVAGILIVISSILATRSARIREAVYYKILGATSGFVLRVFALESLMIGVISGFIAIIISQAGSWIICTTRLDISYKPFIVQSISMAVGITLLVVIVGLVTSISILKQKPVFFLKENAESEA